MISPREKRYKMFNPLLGIVSMVAVLKACFCIPSFFLRERRSLIPLKR